MTYVHNLITLLLPTYHPSTTNRLVNWIIIVCFTMSILFGCNHNNDTQYTRVWSSNILIKNVDSNYYYDNKLFTGILKDTFPNGSIKFEKYFENGMEHGKTTGWHHNGNLSYQYKSIHGKREGNYVEYYPSGNIQINQKYKAGALLASKVIDINGKVLVNFKSKNGRVYGLLGSSTCRSVYDDEQFTKQND